MTFEDLNAMRSELLPQLYVALGEMTQARDILESVLSTTQKPPLSTDAPTAGLSATVVSKLPSLPSLQAFNAQIVIGSKDEALRKAAGLFNTVAERMQRTHEQSEQYWINALKIRGNNWRMVPSPLPAGTFLGKNSDRTARDFLVLYGLEESPPAIRRRGIAYLSDVSDGSQLMFTRRQHMRIKVTLIHRNDDGTEHWTVNRHSVNLESEDLNESLREAQLELVDEEIFSSLIKEASSLPTALARVSERLIVIDASQGVELRFELTKDQASSEDRVSPLCALIYHLLHILLLRRHAYIKAERLNSSGNFPTPNPIGYQPYMLQPIIDFLQYKVFCQRLEKELRYASRGLNAVGVPAEVVFDAVGETGEEIVQIFTESRHRHASGEAILRIENKQTLRLTFVAPSNLNAHLAQATLQVYSLPQLSQLLKTEIERFILQQICQLGEKLRGGTWFIDLNHLVARWEAFVYTFHITFDADMKINCAAFCLDNKSGKRASHHYAETHGSILTWVQNLIEQNS
ncbi:hypothetical protein CC2G_010494 [Coprinopsis cinerea AmutBmut pab1-1]|nr:hypothetical protein CC2G_010494 [Coprinopsis cinerea AmutBmut pab1-1]